MSIELESKVYFEDSTEVEIQVNPDFEVSYQVGAQVGFVSDAVTDSEIEVEVESPGVYVEGHTTEIEVSLAFDKTFEQRLVTNELGGSTSNTTSCKAIFWCTTMIICIILILAEIVLFT